MAVVDNMPVSYEEWRAAYGLTPERDAPFTTLSGEPIAPLYTERDLPVGTPTRRSGCPASIPFTRGVYPSMYRGRLWTMRQFAGFGTAAETNARFRYLTRARPDRPLDGVRHALADGPRLRSSPRSLGEVGREGVAIDTVSTWRRCSTASRSTRSRCR